MRFADFNVDFEVNVYAGEKEDGSKEQVKEHYRANDGKNSCCWVGVDSGQFLGFEITCEKEDQVIIIDIRVDGVLRKVVQFEWFETRNYDFIETVYMRKDQRRRSLQSGYMQIATALPQNYVVLEKESTQHVSGVGMVEFDVYVANDDTKYYTRRGWSFDNDVLDKIQTLAIDSDIAHLLPTHNIKLQPEAELSEECKRSARKLLMTGRPDKGTWASFRFYYRSHSTIENLSAPSTPVKNRGPPASTHIEDANTRSRKRRASIERADGLDWASQSSATESSWGDNPQSKLSIYWDGSVEQSNSSWDGDSQSHSSTTWNEETVSQWSGDSQSEWTTAWEGDVSKQSKSPSSRGGSSDQPEAMPSSSEEPQSKEKEQTLRDETHANTSIEEPLELFPAIRDLPPTTRKLLFKRVNTVVSACASVSEHRETPEERDGYLHSSSCPCQTCEVEKIKSDLRSLINDVQHQGTYQEVLQQMKVLGRDIAGLERDSDSSQEE